MECPHRIGVIPYLLVIYGILELIGHQGIVETLTLPYQVTLPH